MDDASHGGGLKLGQVVGKTDEKEKNLGGTVVARPVSAPDFLATICKALGVDWEKEVTAPGDRPIRLVDKSANPVDELLGCAHVMEPAMSLFIRTCVTRVTLLSLVAVAPVRAGDPAAPAAPTGIYTAEEVPGSPKLTAAGMAWWKDRLIVADRGATT